VTASTKHQDYDRAISQNFLATVRENMALQVRATHIKLASIHDQYLLRGNEQLTMLFRDRLKGLYADYKSAEEQEYGKVLAMLDAGKQAEVAQPAKAFDEAGKELRRVLKEATSVRADTLDFEIKSLQTSLTQLKQSLDTLLDQQNKLVDGIEADFEKDVSTLEPALTAINAHEQAIIDGEKELGEYLNQKSAIEVAVRSALAEFNLKLPISFDAAAERILTKYESRLNSAVDQFNQRSDTSTRK